MFRVWPGCYWSCKHSCIPDRGRLPLCVCLCVLAHVSVCSCASLLIRCLPYVVFRLLSESFFSSSCLPQCAAAVIRLHKRRTLHTFYSPVFLFYSHCVFPLLSLLKLLSYVALKFFHWFTLFLEWLVAARFFKSNILRSTNWCFLIPWITLSSVHMRKSFDQYL